MKAGIARLRSAALLSAVAVCQTHSGGTSEKPVTLLTGLGPWQHRIATKSPEAQQFFNQGLNLLYGFNRYEALRSFRKASDLDAKAAMAYWGIAMATGPQINMDLDGDVDLKSGCEALAKGLLLTESPPREKAYLEAANKRCPEYQPPAYSEAMKNLAASYPDDLDALTFYAESLMVPSRWRWYGADGRPAAGQLEAENKLEEVLRRWPNHPGANHFYIHAVESSSTPERAVPSAQRLMGMVPAVGHMVHMPAHIWLVLGDWELAATLNERAAEMDRRYFAATNVTGAYNGYYIHNLHFVLYAREMQGRKSDALKAAAEMSKGMAPMAAAMPEMMDGFSAVPWLAQVRFGEWDTILKLPQPAASQPLNTVIWHYLRATAMAAKGDRTKAASEEAAFEEARAKIGPDRPFGNNKASDVLAVASASLAARMAPSAGESLPHWQRAVQLQDTLTYDEPPAWYYPSRESLGAALIRAGRAPEAEMVLREGVRRSPKNGRMLFGLLESLKAQNKAEAAANVQRELDAAWQKADVRLSLDSL